MNILFNLTWRLLLLDNNFATQNGEDPRNKASILCSYRTKIFVRRFDFVPNVFHFSLHSFGDWAIIVSTSKLVSLCRENSTKIRPLCKPNKSIKSKESLTFLKLSRQMDMNFEALPLQLIHFCVEHSACRLGYPKLEAECSAQKIMSWRGTDNSLKGM